MAACSLLSSGCWVTREELTGKFNDFDEYLKKREARAKTDQDEKNEALAKELAEIRKSLSVLEVSVRALKEDFVALQANMGMAFESAKKVQDLGTRVEETLGEVQEIEGRVKRSVADMGGKVDAALDKYRELLLEEKRVMQERLRALNENLRALNGGDGKEEKK